MQEFFYYGPGTSFTNCLYIFILILFIYQWNASQSQKAGKTPAKTKHIREVCGGIKFASTCYLGLPHIGMKKIPWLFPDLEQTSVTLNNGKLYREHNMLPTYFSVFFV